MAILSRGGHICPPPGLIGLIYLNMKNQTDMIQHQDSTLALNVNRIVPPFVIILGVFGNVIGKLKS